MTPEYFWEKIEKFRKEKNMSLRAVSRYFGLPDTYLQNLKNKKNSFPTAIKLIKFRELFTDDEMFENLRAYESLTPNAENFLLGLKVSKDARLKSRLKRKMQRGVNV
uniref:helix-turn-helix domain-containing protein n=1 Tax=Lactococcus garvieae TaxID=1363 RepID=UPI00359C759C